MNEVNNNGNGSSSTTRPLNTSSRRAVPLQNNVQYFEATRAGVAPLRRYHRLRRRALKLEKYHPYDFSIPIIEWTRRYAYDSVLEPIVSAVAPLGADYQARMWRGFRERWIDVYENDGKRSGAYSAPVYGVHPYMLLNWADTMDDVFTLAHEMGHSMHTMYSHEQQPFVYSDYTIFVAEVPSTLSEALLLEHWLATAPDSLVAFLSRASCATGTADSRMRVAARRYAANRNASAPSSSSRSARSSNCSASWAFEGSVCATRR